MFSDWFMIWYVHYDVVEQGFDFILNKLFKNCSTWRVTWYYDTITFFIHFRWVLQIWHHWRRQKPLIYMMGIQWGETVAFFADQKKDWRPPIFSIHLIHSAIHCRCIFYFFIRFNMYFNIRQQPFSFLKLHSYRYAYQMRTQCENIDHFEFTQILWSLCHHLLWLSPQFIHFISIYFSYAHIQINAKFTQCAFSLNIYPLEWFISYL